jgi:hypothetical protein
MKEERVLCEAGAGVLYIIQIKVSLENHGGSSSSLGQSMWDLWWNRPTRC